jgi:hypothetical protein
VQEQKNENGLNIKIYWESIVSLGDLIKLCGYIDKNPLAAVFTVEIHGHKLKHQSKYVWRDEL